MDLRALLLIVITSVCTGLLVELVNWAWVYRTAAFKAVAAEMLLLRSKADALEAAGKGKEDKAHKRVTEQLARASVKIFFDRMKTTAVQLGVMAITWRLVANHFAGVPVASLPFVPFALFSRMTHAGLPGDDFTECSSTAIYVLCGIIVRSIISRCINTSSTQALLAAGATNPIADKWKEAMLLEAKQE